MKFIELTEEEFTKFEEKHIYGSFYQTIKWAKLKKTNGWDSFYVGIKDNNKIIAGALLLRKRVLSKLSIIYSPRGFLIDYSDMDTLTLFTKGIKKFAKEKKAFFVKIDPYVIYKERDINGDIVENGIDNSKMISNLKSLGYKHYGFKLEGNLQPQYAFVLYLKNKTIDELEKNMETTTKQMIRKNEKMGIKCREIELKDLEKFTDVMKDTAKRRGFIDRPYSYYKDMFNIFGDDIKILLSEINLDNYLSILTKDLENAEKDLKDKNQKLNLENANKKKINNQIKEIQVIIDSINKKINKTKALIEKEGNNLILGGLMFMIHNKEILSLFGGAYGEYRDFMPAYSLNYDMIKYALENGYEKYNFYGINNYKDPKNEMYGLYDFKRGFGGVVEEYLGEMDLIISKFWFFMYKKVYDGIYVKLKNMKIKK